jgi:uncharacterized membrane protein YhaH (DUF805 family)
MDLFCRTGASRKRAPWAALAFALIWLPCIASASHPAPATESEAFPRALTNYGDAQIESIGARLAHRVEAEPFNAVATIIFVLAILHTFLSSKFLAMAHRWNDAHEQRVASGDAPRNSVSHGAELFHFLGEVEAIFGIWAVVLAIAVVGFFDWETFVGYLSHGVDFTEPMFIVVIMTLASTRPILWLAEALMGRVARLLGGTLASWWLTVLTLGPLLGSFITEPAAMTISALLLARKFYELGPSESFKYATIGVLFVNISVGGTLTNFAAPPVLMVAGPWGWDTSHMILHFGWPAALGITLANTVCFLTFRRELGRLQERFAVRSLTEEIRKKYVTREMMESRIDSALSSAEEEPGVVARIRELIDAEVDQLRARVEPQYLEEVTSRGVDRELAETAFAERFEEVKLARLRKAIPRILPEEQRPEFFDPDWDTREDPVPGWVVGIHVLFLGWTVLNAHHPPLFLAGMLFFLGFAVVASPYQNRIDLKPPLLVGFFLAGLVVHGGLQGWWIEPVLGSLGEIQLMLTATVLTAFNDNAAITFLATLIPGFSDELKHAVVAGAVAGGGLTVIANAPNPAGQAILKRFFENGVSPIKLLAAALAPTVLVWLCLVVLK